MVEHRLIERMISLMRRALIQIEDVQRVDPPPRNRAGAATDFYRAHDVLDG
jgi:hypothetical protein